MKCQVCNERKSVVLETRRMDRTIWRRRSCSGCGATYVTSESYATAMPKAIHKLAHGHGVKARLVVKPKKKEPVEV